MPTGKDLAAAGPKYLGTPYSKMDCQAFVEACLRDIGIRINLPGSNAWYRKMDWVGSPEECRKQFGKVPVGAFLFIWARDGKEPEKYKPDGKGNASHIGIVTETGAIHSSASRGCVAESMFAGKTIKNGGWNMVGLWNRIDYGLKKEGEPVTETVVVLSANGGPVNYRQGPGKDTALMDRIPCGTPVELLEDTGVWSRVRYRGCSGYVMNEFIVHTGESRVDDGDLIQVSKTELQEIYDKLGGLLGLRG